jgi:hypothetical protein
MVVVSKPVLIGNERAHPIEPLAGELLHPTTPQTDEVFVVATRRQWLVPLEPFAKIVFLYQTRRLQQLEGTVNRGLPDVLALPLQGVLDVSHRHVPLRKEHRRGHGLPLLRDGESPVP